MFVAYLVPKEDLQYLPEDGLAYVAAAPTEEEAKAKVIEAHRADQEEQNARSEAAGYGREPHVPWDEDGYVLHTQESK